MHECLANGVHISCSGVPQVILKKISLHNFMCFRGVNTLNLEAKTYAVVAKHDNDAERSNWLGKTSLLEAIDFALYGRHRHRTEDAWITNGEKSGGVLLEFDNGIIVDRSRVRGKRTSLEVLVGGAQAVKERAQEILNERLGLTQEDFTATSYFEQRQMARLILADPGERMAVVAAWLRLEPLQNAEALLREETVKLSWEVEQLLTRLNAARATEAREREAAPKASGDVISGRLDRARVVLADAQAKVEQNAKLQVARTKVSEYDQLLKDGTELRAKVDASDRKKLEKSFERATIDARAAGNTSSQAEREHTQKKRLALGKFDGNCPVAGIECPATKQINSMHENNAKLAASAEKIAKVCADNYETEARALRSATATMQELDRMEQRLGDMRERLKKLHPEYMLAKKAGPTDDVESLYSESNAAMNAVTDLSTQLNAFTRAQTIVNESMVLQEQLTTALEVASAKLATHREAMVVFGKQGAQRKVAEGALGLIEDGANAMLDECGIDLHVEVQWSREGKDLASACDACGHPYPKSAKVKECERCHAERGPQIVNKLDLVLSDRSGAAEDLAGAALQLAASAWLRKSRDSAWSVALIDEPFGQLDTSHRRSFATHLTAMLSGRYGFVQSLVISHSPDATSMLPGRIEITSDGKNSKVRVAA